ncbi:hypothetical protein CVT24_009178 [Panaeolus cyanescens]|uniref:DUF7587 domain-containing protein n=1 Tax=Panaeolus cyanescens TaxID=181874 RepID=A0A409Y8D7_9AGAR|nr:hypothetical protein CVT24_009178 [Panaeolus cyanescens]
MAIDPQETDIGNLLPQSGFGSVIDFQSLVPRNPFLFRVYTPKEKSPFSDDTDPLFVAPKFDELFARTPVEISQASFPDPAAWDCTDVAHHMEWTTRSSSSFISTSFSFSWAIWEAVRRYHLGVKKDIEIAIIDAAAVDGRAATAVELLARGAHEGTIDQFSKWHRFSRDTQAVLVYGLIPRPAVLASIPLLQILRKMPSYFLNRDIQVVDGNPLNLVGWDYANRKSSYRHFCQEMSRAFMQRSVEVRLRDSTGGAVRLALAFLRPFFHRVIQDDADAAISYLRSLSISISQWPGAWAQEHPEIQKVVESMVLALGEELKTKYASHNIDDISRLQVIVDGARKRSRQSGKKYIHEVDVDSDGDFELERGESDEPTLVSLDAAQLPSLEMSVAVLPRNPITFQTPITPPESPRNSLFLPTVTVPLQGILSSPIHDKVGPLPQPAQGRDEDHVLAKTVTAAESLASPPPTPPSHMSVFSAPPTVTQNDNANHSDPGEKTSTSSHDLSEAPAVDQADSQHTVDRLGTLYEVPEEESPVGEEFIQIEHPSPTDNIPMPGGEILSYHDHDDDNASVVSSSISSIPFAPSLTLSRRSSIMSVDTLIDDAEFPAKRLSLSANNSDSFEIFPKHMSLRGLRVGSRTVSFSEAMAPLLTNGLLPSVPTMPDPSRIPLPVSTTGSEYSASRTSSPTSSTCSSAAPSPQMESVELPVPTTPYTFVVPPSKREGDVHGDELRVGESESEENKSPKRLPVMVTETASYIVTGFLVGAFITLFLFSTQRRTLLYCT